MLRRVVSQYRSQRATVQVRPAHRSLDSANVCARAAFAAETMITVTHRSDSRAPAAVGMQPEPPCETGSTREKTLSTARGKTLTSRTISCRLPAKRIHMPR
jgi:hypothetical protein